MKSGVTAALVKTVVDERRELLPGSGEVAMGGRALYVSPPCLRLSAAERNPS